MSQVLYPSKPIPHPTTNPAASSSSSSSSTALPATAGTLASSSSRPKRAAAIASQAATLATSTSGRRKSSQSSNKTDSHPSNRATPSTPQRQPISQAQLSGQSQPATNQRVMAALPRSKRPRRGAEDNVAIGPSHTSKISSTNGRGMEGNGGTSKTSIMMGINSALANGYSQHSTADSSLQESYTDSLRPNTSTSSSVKAENGSHGSIREVINGQEREVFVVDSASPPSANSYPFSYDAGERGRAGTSSTAKGKRKAAASPNTASNNLDAPPAANASTTKRRKKEDNGAGAMPVAPVAPYSSNNKVKVAAVPPNYGYPANAPQYRSGLEAEHTYQSPNGTRWTDNESSHPSRFNVPVDDVEGHYIIREGNVLAGRYTIKSLLGQGTFGKVVRCRDNLQDRQVAIKIIRSIQKYTDAAQIEIRVLQALRDNDPCNENKCIHLIDQFIFRNHVCIVSELLGQSVFDFLKDNDFHPFPCKDIWSFAHQLLRSVAFLHRLELVHTDLKPENILLVSNDHSVVPLTKRANSRKKKALKSSEIRLIDFGSATFNEEYHSQVVSTRHYRAPEIILQMGWSFPCDAWSIGCILIEFYTGEALFQTHDNLEHLAMMEAVLGTMPDDFRRKAETYRPAYFRNNQLDFPNSTTNKQSRKFVKAMKTIDEVINSGAAYSKHDQRFRHLLKRLLTFDPSQRIRVDQALKHPYFDLTPSEIP